MSKLGKLSTGVIIIGAAGLGIKWWLDNQNPDAATYGTAAPGPTSTPTPQPLASTPQHREVTATGKDEHGTVTSLHGDWGSVSKDEAISDIEADRVHYAVAGGQQLDVVAGPTGKYLRSQADGGTDDNLDALPSPADPE